jgi:DNA-binding CsgD family transcriptional regulator
MSQLDDLRRATLERLRARLAFSLTRAATLHRCCSTRPDASYPSTPDWRVRPTSMRSAQRSSPGGSTAAVLHDGLGRYDSAFAAQRACGHDDLGLFGWALIELVEAGVRTGKPDTAAAVFWQLGQRTRARGTERTLGIAGPLPRAAEPRPGSRYPLPRRHRAPGQQPYHGAPGPRPLAVRGMAAPGAPSRRSPRAAAHGPRHVQPHRRRGIRRAGQARAARHRRDARKRAAAAGNQELTAHEAQIARLARDGLSDLEIGTRLFLSPRTVQYHMSNVFAPARHQLAQPAGPRRPAWRAGPPSSLPARRPGSRRNQAGPRTGQLR